MVVNVAVYLLRLQGRAARAGVVERMRWAAEAEVAVAHVVVEGAVRLWAEGPAPEGRGGAWQLLEHASRVEEALAGVGGRASLELEAEAQGDHGGVEHFEDVVSNEEPAVVLLSHRERGGSIWWPGVVQRWQRRRIMKTRSSQTARSRRQTRDEAWHAHV